MRQRYHIIVDDASHVEVIREQLEQSDLTDIKTWASFPLLFNVSLTDAQAAWFQAHPLVQLVVPTTSIHLHEEAQRYEISLNSAADANPVRTALLKLFDIEIQGFDEYRDRMFVVIDEQTYAGILAAIPVTPILLAGIHDIQVSTWYPKEFTRVQDQSRYNWGLSRIASRGPKIHDTVRLTKSGKNTRAYVVDTGVQSNHRELIGRVSADRFDAFRTLGDPLYGEPSTRTEIVDGAVLMDDHGTHVASLIAGSTVGVAVEAEIVSVRAFSNFEESTTEHLLDALDWILTHHAANQLPSVVNMSLAFNDVLVGYQKLSEVITGTLIGAGLVVVVSAGNDATDAFTVAPANAGSRRTLREITPNDFVMETEVLIDYKPIVVGASSYPNATADGKDHVWNKSNWGDVIDFFAPGETIFGASLQLVGDEIDLSQTATYTVKSGTSMSAPLTSGTALLHLEQNPSWTHQSVRSMLKLDTTNNVFPIQETSHGRIDPPRLDTDGTLIMPSNSTVQSPNKMLNVYHLVSEIKWTDSFYEITQPEDTVETYHFLAEGTSFYENKESLAYRSEPIDIPDDFGVPVFNYSFDYTDPVDPFNPISKLNFRFTSPRVPTRTTGIYGLIASDDRVWCARRLTVHVENVPTPPVWIQPAAGEITVTPAHKGDLFDSSLFFRAQQEDGFRINYTMTPHDALPAGLQFVNDPDNNRCYLMGRIARVPMSDDPVVYEFLIRATDSAGAIAERLFTLTCEYVNETHYFSPSWLSALYDYDSAYPGVKLLAEAGAGSSFYKRIQVENNDSDPLTYTVEFVPSVVTGPEVFNGILPTGLGINSEGEIKGIVDPAADLGAYYFRVVVEDTSGIAIYQDFVIVLKEDVDDVLDDSDQIIWVTPPGNIGQIYETFASHLGVEAQNPEGSGVKYSLSNGVLPDGMEVETNTGYITGMAPFVVQDVRYFFTVRASVGPRYIDRDFSLDVLTQYDSQNVLQFRANVMGPDRLEIVDWGRGSQILTDQVVFRPTDPNFGAPQYPSMYVVSGTSVVSPHLVHSYLKDYHKRMYLLFGPIGFAPAYDPSGYHAYDTLFISVIDPQTKAGGFDSAGVEQTLLEWQKHPFDPTLWNPDTEDSRFFPNTVKNARADLISTEESRLGLGINGTEGLPLWQRSGFVPAIPFAYVKPGLGQRLTNELIKKGMNKAFVGRNFILDRYFISGVGTGVTTLFDVVDDAATTVFDDPDQPNVQGDDLSGLSQPTEFDVLTVETGKYYKFEDDTNIIADRNDNPHR